jgi:hypothetical protein
MILLKWSLHKYGGHPSQHKVLLNNATDLRVLLNAENLLSKRVSVFQIGLSSNQSLCSFIQYRHYTQFHGIHNFPNGNRPNRPQENHYCTARDHWATISKPRNHKCLSSQKGTVSWPMKTLERYQHISQNCGCFSSSSIVVLTRQEQWVLSHTVWWCLRCIQVPD